MSTPLLSQDQIDLIALDAATEVVLIVEEIARVQHDGGFSETTLDHLREQVEHDLRETVLLNLRLPEGGEGE
ncbi:MAG: hypothetical protein JWQ48_2412 [Conexibacter sp.]|nr:hypothetical protein [Conexibacter sp.]